MLKMKKGFTLIELLVVIAIIAILATIVIINLSQARGKANNTTAIANLRNSHTIAISCVNDGFDLTGVPTTVVAPVIPIGVLTTTATTGPICQNTTVDPGFWQDITTRSSAGRDWVMGGVTGTNVTERSTGPVSPATNATPLVIQANTETVQGTSAVGDLKIKCETTGCIKLQATIAATPGTWVTGTW